VSIDALIQGRMHGAPRERTSKTGSPFVTAMLRVATRDGGSLFASVICFNGTGCKALMVLGDGDSVAVSGEATLKLYQPRDGGEPRPSLDLLAHAVLSPYHVKRRRDAMAEAKAQERAAPEPTEAAAPAELDDPIPF